MFGIFKSKSQKEKLEEEYQKLMDKSYKVQESDANAAEKIRIKAQKIMQQIVLMERELKFSTT